MVDKASPIRDTCAMTYDDLIAHFGSQEAAREALGIKHRQTLHKWQKRIPLGTQAVIELQTNGALRADLPNRPVPEAQA